MKKLMNAPEQFLDDALQGFSEAFSDLVRLDPKSRSVYRRNQKDKGKVALISGGGSGHEPMHVGYVGYGMLDAACAGEIFTSPTPDQMVAAATAVKTGGGLIFIVKNYAGDIMNFEMAADMLGGEVEVVVTDDDVALSDGEHASSQGGRGVAGTIVVEKIMGAAAERGVSLAECANFGRRVNAATGSMAVALRGCTVPAAGTPTFTLGEDELELGVGIHGERGRERASMKMASELVEIFIESILGRVRPNKTDPLLLLCNGLGATPPIELFGFYHAARVRLETLGYDVRRSLVGTFCTALDMAGASVTVTKLDAETVPLWDAPAKAAAFRCS